MTAANVAIITSAVTSIIYAVGHVAVMIIRACRGEPLPADDPSTAAAKRQAPTPIAQPQKGP